MAAGVKAEEIDGPANAVLLLRLLYTYVYSTGAQAWKGIARSLCFAGSFGICIHLMVKAAAVYSAKRGV